MKYVALITLCVMLTACAQTSNPQETITVGGLHHLSGIGIQFGTDEMRGAQLAVNEINAAGGVNGKQIVYVVEDSQTDNTATVNAYRKLVTVEGVKYIIGPPWGPYAQLIIPLLTEDDVIEITPAVGEELAEYKHPNFFRIWPADKYEAEPVYAHMQSNGIKTVGLITSAESFGASMREGILEMKGDTPIEIKHDLTVDIGEKDFRTTVLKTKDVNALYVVTAGYSEIALIIAQARELGFKGPIYGFSGIDQNKEFREVCNNRCSNVLIPITRDSPAMLAFNEKFTAAYGEKPSTPAAATSYDGMRMLAKALESGEDSASVRSGLHSIQNFDGVSGIRSFEKDKGWPIVERTYILKTLKDGEYVQIVETS